MTHGGKTSPDPEVLHAAFDGRRRFKQPDGPL
jgi:hypothetical protein